MNAHRATAKKILGLSSPGIAQQSLSMRMDPVLLRQKAIRAF